MKPSRIHLEAQRRVNEEILKKQKHITKLVVTFNNKLYKIRYLSVAENIIRIQALDKNEEVTGEVIERKLDSADIGYFGI